MLEALKRDKQRPLAGRPYEFRDHLIAAAGLVNTDSAVDDDTHSVFELEAQRGRPLLPKRNGDLGVAPAGVVFECEVNVPGARSGQADNFAVDSDRRKGPLEEPLDVAR